MQGKQPGVIETGSTSGRLSISPVSGCLFGMRYISMIPNMSGSHLLFFILINDRISMKEKMSLLLVSGTADKLMAGAIIASGAIANDMEVDIFVSFWGLMEFKKGASKKVNLSYDGIEIKDEVLKKMEQKKIPSWMDMIKQAKEVGDVKIYACAMFADLMDLKKDDLDPVVDEIIGVSQFVSMAKEAKMTLFI
jgi:peroxiredoxin family protein